MAPSASALALRRTHDLLARDGVRLFVRRDWREALPVDALLAGLPLERWGEPRAHDLVGRGRVHVLGTPRGELVAKRMSRGGVIGGLLRETYGDPDRPVREALLAERLLAAGCRTPPVVLLRCTRRSPLNWRLELATARVPGGRDLLALLHELQAAARSPGALAGRTGRSLAQLHVAGLQHRDLQVKNLVVPPDDGALYVLDLDRCRLRDPLPAAARRRGLLRFLRSLAKHGLLSRAGADPDPRFAAELLDGVLAGYAPEGVSGLATGELRAALERQLRFHARFWGPAGRG